MAAGRGRVALPGSLTCLAWRRSPTADTTGRRDAADATWPEGSHPVARRRSPDELPLDRLRVRRRSVGANVHRRGAPCFTALVPRGMSSASSRIRRTTSSRYPNIPHTTAYDSPDTIHGRWHSAVMLNQTKVTQNQTLNERRQNDRGED